MNLKQDFLIVRGGEWRYSPRKISGCSIYYHTMNRRNPGFRCWRPGCVSYPQELKKTVMEYGGDPSGPI